LSRSPRLATSDVADVRIERVKADLGYDPVGGRVALPGPHNQVLFRELDLGSRLLTPCE